MGCSHVVFVCCGDNSLSASLASRRCRFKFFLLLVIWINSNLYSFFLLKKPFLNICCKVCCNLSHLMFFFVLSCELLWIDCSANRLIDYCLLIYQVRLLLKYGASPLVENNALKTPMDLACEFGKYQVWSAYKSLLSSAVLEFLSFLNS